jgi:hypothetical protein
LVPKLRASGFFVRVIPCRIPSCSHTYAHIHQMQLIVGHAAGFPDYLVDYFVV